MLAAVGSTLALAVRSVDAVGRYGGDEFVVILPETDEPAANLLAERVREQIARATAALVGWPVHARTGVAAWRPGHSPDVLLEAADQAMARRTPFFRLTTYHAAKNHVRSGSRVLSSTVPAVTEVSLRQAVHRRRPRLACQ